MTHTASRFAAVAMLKGSTGEIEDMKNTKARMKKLSSVFARGATLAAIVLALPTLAFAQSVAVARLTSLPAGGGEARDIYIKVGANTQTTADAFALAQCAEERRKTRTGGIAPDRSRCDLSTVTEFEVAKRATEHPTQYTVLKP